MVDMARSPQELKENMTPVAYQPSIYPGGLSVCLTQDELEKLDMEADCEVGDMLHMVCMLKVTSVSKNETPDGESCRVECQIIDIEVLEDENTEFSPRIDISKFYG